MTQVEKTPEKLFQERIEKHRADYYDPVQSAFNKVVQTNETVTVMFEKHEDMAKSLQSNLQTIINHERLKRKERISTYKRLHPDEKSDQAEAEAYGLTHLHLKCIELLEKVNTERTRFVTNVNNNICKFIKLNQNIEKMKANIESIKGKIKLAKREYDLHKSQVESLKKETDLLNETLKEANDNNDLTESYLINQANQNVSTFNKIRTFYEQINALKRQINNLEYSKRKIYPTKKQESDTHNVQKPVEGQKDKNPV